MAAYYHRASFGIGHVGAIDDSVTPNQAYGIAIVKGIAIEFKASTKPLKGNLLIAVDQAIDSVDITGKIQSQDSLAFVAPLIIPGTTSATGREKFARQSTLIPGTPFTITVTNSATWATDLGVVNLTTGKRMTRVASAPAAGQYSVAAGVYTFASAEGTVVIEYSYTDASTGKTRTFTNAAVGASSGYQLKVFDPQGGTRESGYFFPSVKFGSGSGGMKIDDWSDTSLDFAVNADSTGKVFDIYSDD